MDGIALELKGNTAFFKKPDVNAQVYFTYSQIHKIALLGIFGAILGYGGYKEQHQDLIDYGEREENFFPVFYQKLKDLKVSIVPHGDRGYFSKKIQTFNNSVGYASAEKGRNLIVKEQWLEEPHWTIYILNDGTAGFKQLKQSLLQKKAVYLPYLGKNDHPATINSIREVDLIDGRDTDRIDSLFIVKDVQLGRGFHRGSHYFYRERLPIALEENWNGYIFAEMMMTNRKIEKINTGGNVFLAEERYLFFC